MGTQKDINIFLWKSKNSLIMLRVLHIKTQVCYELSNNFMNLFLQKLWIILQQ